MKKITIDGVEYVEKSKVEKVRTVTNGTIDNPFMIIGNSYFIRTVTHYFTGVLIWVGEKEIAITKACWIADTGRFNEFMKENPANESEPYPENLNVIIGRGSIIDMTERGLILEVK